MIGLSLTTGQGVSVRLIQLFWELGQSVSSYRLMV